MRPGQLSKSIRMIKTNVAQVKRTQKALKSEGYNEYADSIQKAIDILENLYRWW